MNRRSELASATAGILSTAACTVVVAAILFGVRSCMDPIPAYGASQVFSQPETVPGPATGNGFKPYVSTASALPTSGNSIGDCRMAADTGAIWCWTSAGWASPTGGSGTGTVTEVGLVLPASMFSVTNSPVNTTGNLTGSFVAIGANLFWAGPASGSAATPGYRAITTPDIAAALTAASTSAPGIVQLATSGGTTAGQAVQASDSRLSNSRTPSGSAGGVLTGAYPNPSGLAASSVGLSQVTGACTPGTGTDVVTWNTSGTPSCTATPSGGGGGPTVPGTTVANGLTTWGNTTGGSLLSPAGPTLSCSGGACSLLSSGNALFLGTSSASYLELITNNITRWVINPGSGRFEDGSGNGGNASIIFNAGSGGSGYGFAIYSFVSDTTTGFGEAALGQPALYVSGTEAAHADSTGITVDLSIKLKPQASAPYPCTAPPGGGIYYNGTLNAFCFCNGTTWALWTGLNGGC